MKLETLSKSLKSKGIKTTFSAPYFDCNSSNIFYVLSLLLQANIIVAFNSANLLAVSEPIPVLAPVIIIT
jgi:hypothetical protein